MTDKTQEARKLAQQFGVRMCDENGDTHGEELYCLGLDDIIALREALAEQPAQQHPDDIAIDRCAEAMKAKMAKQRAKGYGGWDDPAACPTERLQAMLTDHIAKGDPVDVANFAMMLWNRGERTEQPAQQQEPKQSEIFCGVDFADGLLSVSVFRRRDDDVAELLHAEQIELPAQKQKSVAWMRHDGERVTTAADRKNYPDYETRYPIPLYTSPPASKPWVGLTDEERLELIEHADGSEYSDDEFINAIEAKLREKNA